MREADQYRKAYALELHAQKVKGQSEHIELTENYLSQSKLPTDAFMSLRVEKPFFSTKGAENPEEEAMDDIQ